MKGSHWIDWNFFSAVGAGQCSSSREKPNGWREARCRVSAAGQERGDARGLDGRILGRRGLVGFLLCSVATVLLSVVSAGPAKSATVRAAEGSGGGAGSADPTTGDKGRSQPSSELEEVATVEGRAPALSCWKTLGTADGLPSEKVFAVAVEGERVWAGTEKGLALVENGVVRKVYGVKNGLPFQAVTALAVSPSTGDLWVGTMGGLARFSGGRFDTFTQLDSGLVNDVIYGIAVDGPVIWIATAAGLNRYDTETGVWEIYDTTNTLMHEPWCYAVTASDGRVYVAVWGGGIVVRDGKTGRFREHRDPDKELEIDLFRDDGLVHDVTSAVAVDEGITWAGTYFGLSRYDGRRWRSYNQSDSGLAGDFINYLKTRAGVLWIATDQGLGWFDGTQWQTWRKGKEESEFRWLFTDSKGKTHSFPTESGPPSNTIFGIELDGEGNPWLATAKGLTHAWSCSGNP